MKSFKYEGNKFIFNANRGTYKMYHCEYKYTQKCKSLLKLLPSFTVSEATNHSKKCQYFTYKSAEGPKKLREEVKGKTELPIRIPTKNFTKILTPYSSSNSERSSENDKESEDGKNNDDGGINEAENYIEKDKEIEPLSQAPLNFENLEPRKTKEEEAKEEKERKLQEMTEEISNTLARARAGAKRIIEKWQEQAIKPATSMEAFRKVIKSNMKKAKK